MTLTTGPAGLLPRQAPPGPAHTVSAGPGFRLARLEVLNWGTFHRTTRTFTVDRHSALLTGGVGSGKSTLVGAITTLLLGGFSYISEGEPPELPAAHRRPGRDTPYDDGRLWR